MIWFQQFWNYTLRPWTNRRLWLLLLRLLKFKFEYRNICIQIFLVYLFKNIETKRRLNSTYDCKNACCSWAAHACPPSSHALLHIEVFYRVCWWSLEDYYLGIAYPDILFRYHIFDYMSTTHSIMSTSLQLKNVLMFCVPFKVDTLIENFISLNL